MSVECVSYRPFKKGCLEGFADLWVPKMGLEFYGCTVHSKDGKRWLNLPSKEYEDKDSGERKFRHVVRFRNSAHYTQFGIHALESIDRWIQANPEFPKDEDEEVPF